MCKCIAAIYSVIVATIEFAVEKLNDLYRRASYFLMGYRRAPFTIVRMGNKWRFWPLKADARQGSMKWGVFSRRDVVSLAVQHRKEACHLWPDGMRWNFFIIATLIALPIVVSGSHGYAALAFFFLSVFVPMTVYGFFRLPVLDFLKEGMPKSINNRIDRFPFRSRRAFVLCLALLSLVFSFVLFPNIIEIIWNQYDILLRLIHNQFLLCIEQIKNTLDVLLIPFRSNRFTIFLIYFILLFTILIIFYCTYRAIMYILKLVAQKFMRNVPPEIIDGYHLFIPPILSHGETVFYSPKGSIKESLIRLALCEFYAKNPEENNRNLVWTSRSFIRFLVYWCTSVWSGYLTLWILMLPYLLQPMCIITSSYEAALYFSALLWMLYSATFMWNQAKVHSFWLTMGEEDENMLPPVLIGKIKERSMVAESIDVPNTRVIIQFIATIALTLYWSILRYVIHT